MSHPATKSLRLLVIDDDAVMRELLTLVLGSEGHTVLTAISGDDALPLLADTTAPDVILTDMQMPGLAGVPLAEELRRRCPATVLLGMSGNKLTREESAHFDGFLEKPFTPADFARAVAEANGRKAPHADQPAAVTEFPALDERTFRRFSATLPPGPLREMYDLCLHDVATRVAKMTAAAETGDAAMFCREAHAIKGGCGMLGALELQHLASQMEGGALAYTSLLGDFTLAVERLRRILNARFSTASQA
jgi:CheY-like chemotaxis protein